MDFRLNTSSYQKALINKVFTSCISFEIVKPGFLKMGSSISVPVIEFTGAIKDHYKIQVHKIDSMKKNLP